MAMVSRNFLNNWKEKYPHLFREPGTPGRYYTFGPTRRRLVLGLLLTAGLFFLLFAIPYALNPMLLGIVAWMFLGMLAELLPRQRTTLAGVLRLGSIVAIPLGFITWIAIVIVSLAQLRA